MEKTKRTNPSIRKKRFLSRGRVFVLVAAVLFCLACAAGYVYMEFMQPKLEANKTVELTERLRKAAAQQTPEETAAQEPDEPLPVLPKYEALLAENGDLKGWFSVPELNLDLPVVQGPDNEYYLRRNFSGQWSLAGTPFFDYRVRDFQHLPRNTIIYGHNMRRTDMMFGAFQKLRTPEGFRQSPVIELGTLYSDLRWFVYGVFVTNADSRQDNGYFFPYTFIDMPDEDFEAYVRELDQRKLYSTGVELTAQDKILTVSTCCYDFRNARLVVVARLQRPGERDTPDVEHTALNSSPRYPQAWYTANGLENPYADAGQWSIPAAQP